MVSEPVAQTLRPSGLSTPRTKPRKLDQNKIKQKKIEQSARSSLLKLVYKI